MSTALLVLAVLVVFIRLIYVWRFAYKTRIDQPRLYPTAKRILNISTIVLVLSAACFLISDDSVISAIVLVVGTFIVTFIVQGGAYTRAALILSNSKDPKTGEYIFQGAPAERDQLAKTLIDLDRI